MCGVMSRENRSVRDNSEDTLTWNVFRFLEKHNLTGEFLKKCRFFLKKVAVIFVSY